MSKLISILIALLILLAGWKLVEYWQNIQNDRGTVKKEAPACVLSPEQLPGMPYQLQPSLDAAEKQGATALRNWLTTYDRYLQDPRKASIELDYCVMIARNNPNEARRTFAAVKQRTPPSSPVWPRVQQLRKSYE
jgi:hypothetical protein